jgi:3-keto-5-aminohexanoate cleavage enzyme
MSELPAEAVVITAAIVGAEVTREQTPHVPYTAEEIAEEARRCAEAGAAVVHLHVRSDTGAPSQDAERFREAIAKIRARTDLVIQVSTGGAVGMGIEERLGGLAAEPEMATLNCGSINFGDEVFENSLPAMRDVARRIAAAGAVPELELYELGHLDNALRLEAQGLLARPFWVQLVLGVPGALGARESVLRFFVSELPAGTHWGVAAVGKHQSPMLSLALELGGHVRVGLEDNIYLERGVLARGSAPFVERIAREAQQRGRSPASPAMVRRALARPSP